MWQTKYALTIPKNLGVGVSFRPFNEGYFHSGGLYSPLDETTNEHMLETYCAFKMSKISIKSNSSKYKKIDPSRLCSVQLFKAT